MKPFSAKSLAFASVFVVVAAIVFAFLGTTFAVRGDAAVVGALLIAFFTVMFVTMALDFFFSSRRALAAATVAFVLTFAALALANVLVAYPRGD